MKSRNIVLILLTCLVLFCLCLLVLGVLFWGYFFYTRSPGGVNPPTFPAIPIPATLQPFQPTGLSLGLATPSPAPIAACPGCSP